MFKALITWLRKITMTEETQSNETDSVLTPLLTQSWQVPMKVIPPPLTLLERMAVAIRDFEGVPGDRNYRNNNPGNCRFSAVGYLAKYDPVTCDADNFAVFPSYSIGFMYLCNLIKNKIENNPNQTLLEFMESYAPVTDGNNPTTYAGFIAKRLGVDTAFVMKGILQ